MASNELNVTNDVEAFNRWSTTYEDSWLQSVYFDRIHNGVLRLVTLESSPGCIVDVGCGTGRLLRKILKRWLHARLIGVDPAEGMVKKARQMMPDATFIVGPAESIPLPDASADLVFSTTSFHHWQDQQQGIREIRRVLRPGGQFILADVMFPSFLIPLFHHCHIRTPLEVRGMFEHAGLKVQKQQRIMLRHFLVTVGIKSDG